MNTVRHRLLFAVVTALFLASAFRIADLPADTAQNGAGPKAAGSPAPRVFSIHDIDQDGALSREKYRRLIEDIENRHNATGRPMHRLLPPLRFEEIDSNGDGLIVEDEMIAALNRRMERHRHYRYRGGQW